MKGPQHRFELTITNPNGDVSTHPLPDGDHVIGRSPHCEIYLHEPSISRQHARISVSGELITVTDLESLNGTQLKDLPLNGSSPCEPGDPLLFGELEGVVRDVHAEAGPEQVWVEVLNTSLKGKVHEVMGTRIVIGRGSNADFVLNHPTISRAHAVLSYSPRERAWLLEDRKSANGTFVNDVMISQSLVSKEDTLRVGDVELRFSSLRPSGSRRRTGMLIVLVLLLGSAISLLVADLLGLLVE